MATAALTTQPVKAQALGSKHIGYYDQCQWEGGALARASAQLDVTFAFAELREVEKVSLGSLSPQLSASHDLIVPGNGQDWTGRSPDSKGPWRHKNVYSPSGVSFVLLHSHTVGLWAVSLALWGYFPFNSPWPGLALRIYPVLIQETDTCNLVLHLL